jgi:hypothetical protein
LKLYVSPSELELYQSCQRKWAYKYVLKIDVPSHKSALLGTQVHKILENWLKHATPPDLRTRQGAIAAELILLSPPPQMPGLQVEHAFAFKSQRAWYTGVKDVRVKVGPIPIIGDHKTTSNLAYAKDRAQLLAHPQVPIYATDEFLDPSVDIVEIRWNYVHTSGSHKTQPVWFQVGRNEIQDIFFGTLDPLAGEVEFMRMNEPDPQELPPTYETCEAYGGCPYLSICNPNPKERLYSIMSQSSLLARLQSGQPPAPNGAPAAGPPPQGWAPPTGAAPTPQQQYAPPPGGNEVPQFTPPAGAPQWQGQVPQQWQQPQGNGPAFAPSPQPSGPAQGWPGAGPGAMQAHVTEHPGLSQVFSPAVTQRPAKKTRKSRKQVTSIDGTAPAAQTDEEGFTLFIDCMPMGEENTRVSDYVEASRQLMGTSPKDLQQACEAVIASNDKLKGYVVLLSVYPDEKDLIHLFSDLADTVVMRAG